MTDKIVVLVTCGSRGEAQKIARALVEKRLAACVNIPGARVHSIFRWKGRVESAREWLLIIKSTRGRMKALRAEVERLHSYDVPEVIALPVAGGAPRYLAWVAEAVRPARGGRKK